MTVDGTACWIGVSDAGGSIGVMVSAPAELSPAPAELSPAPAGPGAFVACGAGRAAPVHATIRRAAASFASVIIAPVLVDLVDLVDLVELTACTGSCRAAAGASMPDRPDRFAAIEYLGGCIAVEQRRTDHACDSLAPEQRVTAAFDSCRDATTQQPRTCWIRCRALELAPGR
jgi:hypothetical protein